MAEETGIPVAALLDTKGPEIRTGILKDGKKITLKEGQEFTLTTEEVVGDETMVHINYDGLNGDVKVGDRILIDDGLDRAACEGGPGSQDRLSGSKTAASWAREKVSTCQA